MNTTTPTRPENVQPTAQQTNITHKASGSQPLRWMEPNPVLQLW